MDHLVEGSQIIGRDYTYLYLNDSAVRHAKLPREALIGRRMADVYPGIDATPMFALLKACMERGESAEMDNAFSYPDGTTGFFQLRFEPVPEGVWILSTDVTDKRRAEARIVHLNAVLRGIRSVNRLITRERDPDALLQGTCELLVSSRGFNAAIISVHRDGTVLRSAHASDANAALAAGGDLAGTVPQCVQDLSLDKELLLVCGPGDARCAGCPLLPLLWSDHRAVIVPMHVGPHVQAALWVLGRHTIADDHEELELLREIAADVGMALRAIELEAEREQHGSDLARARARYQGLIDNLDDLVFSTDLRGNVEFVSPSVERMLGYTPHEIEGHHFSKFVAGMDVDDLPAVVLSAGTDSLGPFEFAMNDRQGRPLHLRSLTRLRYEDGVPVGLDGVIVDLTELRRAEDAERETLSAHSALLANLPGVAYRCRIDPDWTMEILSEGCLKLTGHPADDLVLNARCAYADLIHPDDRHAVDEELRRACAERRRFHVAYRITTASGQERQIEETGSPVVDPSGVVTHLEGFLTDITQRSHAESRASDLNRRLALLAEVVKGLAAARDVDKVMQIARDAARQLVDADGACVVHRDGELTVCVAEDTIAQLPPEQWLPLTNSIADWTVAHGQVAAVEDVFDDGRIAPETFRGTFVKSLVMVPLRPSEPLGAIGVYRAQRHLASPDELRLLQALADSTTVALEQVRIMEEIERGRTGIRAIYDRLPHATFVWRRQHDGFALADVNAPAVELARLCLGDLDPISAADLAERIPELLLDLQRCLDAQCPVRREVEVEPTRSTGRRRLMLTYGVLAPDLVLLHAEDVTEQRKAEEQLGLVQRLEAVGRLAGGVAHEFNNVLSVILSFTEFVMDAMPDSDPRRNDLLEVRKAANYAAELTHQLLAFSRKQVLEPRRLSLNAIAGDMMAMLVRLVGEDIDVRTTFASELGTVVADPGQLEQVLMNLVVNARAAMPQGGRLMIETRRVELDEGYAALHTAVKPGPYALLSVSDTGCGIDAATRDRVFEPFFTTREKGQGTGLGLSTVYGIIKQSGGNVWVYSEPGLGTTFKIYLPIVDGPCPHASTVNPPTPSTGAEAVLVVEDDDAVRRVTERILKVAGYKVWTAASGKEAIALFAQHGDAITMLLTDVVMPGMSGRELATRLLLERPTLKVLFTSGYTDDAISQHGVLDHGTHFISKPFAADELRRKVHELLDAAD